MGELLRTWALAAGVAASLLSVSHGAWAAACDLPRELEAVFMIVSKSEPAPFARETLPPTHLSDAKLILEGYPDLAIRRAITNAKKTPSNRFMSRSAPPPKVLAAVHNLIPLEEGTAKWGEALERLQFEVDLAFKAYGFETKIEIEDGGVSAVVQPPKKARKNAHWIANLSHTLSRRKPPHRLSFAITGADTETATYHAARRQIGLTWDTPRSRAITPDAVHELVHYNQARVALAEDAGHTSGSLTRQPIAASISTPNRPFEETRSPHISEAAESRYGGEGGHWVEEYESIWRESKMAYNSWTAEMRRIEITLNKLERLSPESLKQQLPKIKTAIERRLAEAQHAKIWFEARKAWVRGFVGHDGPILDEVIVLLDSGAAPDMFRRGSVRLADGSEILVDAAEISARHPDADLTTDGDRLLLEELIRLRAHQQSRLDALDKFEKTASSATYATEALERRLTHLLYQK